MKTVEVITQLGNKSRVAEALGLSRAAITSWGEQVPLLRQYQLREKFPELFPANDETNKEQAA